ncbi:hypothetical protein BU25DRAFT_351865 [Macroventuria anomochaeta]|uniref:Uncharacterized protein n=1 Tax=Macroventuria anomochaeta TaxID=301207 RepID=A0ACB6RL89_9PLEO|nr:uncharacterized protein BU25DRAFT_351865 [Macroventuria anomochaeta]KAF2622636.1 hypothetical protein BU25DRAFT_351865 [Macroventuria anomochaeta]
MKASSLAWNSHYPTASPRISIYVPSRVPYPYKNGTAASSAWISTITPVSRGQCTGCALAALNPITTSYESALFGNWTSLVVTETLLIEFVTYVDNSTIDTVVTETKTVNQTKTVDNWITDTAAEFNIYLPTPGLDLTLDVGPTYVIYTSLFGGPDAAVQINATAQNNATHSELRPTQSTCRPHVSSLRNWIPTRTQDWDFFIQTFANGSTPEPTAMDTPVPVPTKLQNFLAQDPDLQHITKQGCLRCDTNPGDLPKTPKPTEQDPNTNKINDDPVPTKSPNPKNDDAPKSNDNPNGDGGPKTDDKPQDQPQNTPQSPPKPDVKTTPSVPDILSSIISDNPSLTRKPQEQPTNSGQTITIGNSVVTVKPQPTKQGQGGPNQQTNAPTMVIIGTQTVTVGQTTTINGVPVAVPTAGGGSTIIVGDKTIGLNPRITQAPLPVLTVGHNTITANSQGQFVVGMQTLQRGGPLVILDDHTLTLGPNGRIAIWNSATQTLVTMAGPSGAPAVTFGGQSITAKLLGGTTVFVLGDKTLAPGSAVTVDGTTFSLPSGFHGSSVVTATVVHGTTAFVFGPDETLTPGGVVTVSGTTFSLPASASGSVVVINGVTSTLAPESGMGPITSAPPIIVDGKTITATTRDGKTEYIINSATTLLPGGQIIIDGTTYSLAPGGTALIIDGKTSIISSTPASNSASTTGSGSSSETTSERGAGDFIASGIGESSRSQGAGSWTYGRRANKWVESLVMGVAGWLLWFL